MIFLKIIQLVLYGTIVILSLIFPNDFGTHKRNSIDKYYEQLAKSISLDTYATQRSWSNFERIT